MRIVIILVMTMLVSSVLAQSDSGVKYARQIDTLDLKKYVYKMASDEMEGRKTGSAGLEKAAAFIESQYRSIGLQPVLNNGTSYRQEFELVKSSPEINHIVLNGQALINGVDYIFEGDMDMPQAKEDTLILLSKTQLESPGQLDIKDKVVAFTRLDDPFKNFSLYKKLTELKPDLIIQIVHTQSLEAFLGASQNSGERGTYMTLNPFERKGFGRVYMDMARLVKVTGYTRKDLLEDGAEISIDYHIRRKKERVKTSNLLGVIAGEQASNGVVVISAHYDHEGIKKGVLYPGADDNASGVAGLLEIAQAFQMAYEGGFRFKKSILFVMFSAEEDGLLGSGFLTKNSPFPLSDITVNLNIDMIGRVAPEYDGFEEYIYLAKSDKLSKQLHRISERVNDKFTGLTLDYSYNSPDHPLQVFKRGDHWSFAKEGVPVIFYFDGIHDDYHRPTDKADRINYGLLQLRSNLVFQTAWSIVSAEGALELKKQR
ncbi:MAG: M28 family peptidase [Roseivirga sp.]|nr:M28 family peptidase [Roseivirga sp.]